MGGSTAVVLLNGHVVELSSKYLCLCSWVMLWLSLVREASICGWVVVNTETLNRVTDE